MIPGWGVIAIVASGFMFAAFRAWLDERKLREAEMAKYSSQFEAKDDEIAALRSGKGRPSVEIWNELEALWRAGVGLGHDWIIEARIIG